MGFFESRSCSYIRNSIVLFVLLLLLLGLSLCLLLMQNKFTFNRSRIKPISLKLILLFFMKHFSYSMSLPIIYLSIINPLTMIKVKFSFSIGFTIDFSLVIKIFVWTNTYIIYSFSIRLVISKSTPIIPVKVPMAIWLIF
jgi:hypothetical protein